MESDEDFAQEVSRITHSPPVFQPASPTPAAPAKQAVEVYDVHTLFQARREVALLGHISCSEIPTDDTPKPLVKTPKVVRAFSSTSVLQGVPPLSLQIPAHQCVLTLLPLASAALNMNAKRVFSLHGAEYSRWWSTEHIQQGDALVFSDGPTFVPHTMIGLSLALGTHHWQTFVPPAAPDGYLLN